MDYKNLFYFDIEILSWKELFVKVWLAGLLQSTGQYPVAGQDCQILDKIGGSGGSEESRAWFQAL